MLATISDRKIGIDVNSDGIADFYDAETLSLQDYYPFGMQISARSFQSYEYKYGFNGAEKDDEIKGEGNSYDFGARIYDSRLGKFLSLDPRMADFPFMSPYCFAANTPIMAIDVNGEFGQVVVGFFVGGIIGGGIEIGKQMFSGTKFKDIEWKKVGLAAGKGALNGAIISTGIGATYVGVTCASTEFAADYIEQKAIDKKPKWDYQKTITKSIIAGATGFIFSMFSRAINGSKNPMFADGVPAEYIFMNNPTISEIPKMSIGKAFSDLTDELLIIAIETTVDGVGASFDAKFPDMSETDWPKVFPEEAIIIDWERETEIITTE